MSAACRASKENKDVTAVFIKETEVEAMLKNFYSWFVNL